MRERYLEFVWLMSNAFAGMFGRFWWHSAFAEKNIHRFDTYHNLTKNRLLKDRFTIMSAFLSAWKRYLTFIYRKVFSMFWSGLRKPRFKHWNLKVGYDYEPDQDCDFVIMPKRNRIYDRRAYLIDEFFPFIGLFFLPFKILFRMFWFLILFWPFRVAFQHFSLKVFGEDVWLYFRKEIWRSFFGDVLVEGLYWDAAFQELSKHWIRRNKEWQTIYYQYEGLAWEKALCYWFGKRQEGFLPSVKIGIMNSVPSENHLHYFRHLNEAMVMPKPDRIESLGPRTTELLARCFPENMIEKRGKDRRKRAENIPVTADKSGILVILGGVDRQVQELIDWAKVYENRYFGCRKYLSIHPDNGKLNIPDCFEVCDWQKMIGQVALVIVAESGLAVEAAVCGAQVVVPSLPSFVDMCPLEGRYRDKVNDRQEILDRYFF